MGHPCLQRSAASVLLPAQATDATLVADMLATMEDAGGTGLAAPQVYADRRIIVYYVAAHRNQGKSVPVQVLVNPVLTPLDERVSYDWEACLSVPGLSGLVPRYKAVNWSAYDMTGAEIHGEAHDFHARVLQHEIDHLDGFLYPMRMDDLSLLVFQDQLKYGIPEKARTLMEAAKDGG